MSPDFLVNPAVFLIDTLFSLYIFAILLRFLFQWVDADYYNPISQFLIKITHPPLRMFRRFIPSVGRVDTASLVLMLGLQMLSGYLIFVLQDTRITFAALSLWAVVQLLDLLFNVYFFAIIIRAVLSWVSPGSYNPAVSLLYSLTEPLLRFSRRLLPPIGGIDLSPLIPLIGIQLAKMLVLPPLQQLTNLLN
ncbi:MULTISPECIES: YggT family protein [Methylocaldum]|jgi:YggT family protein|uniref:YggT family protein n=1 Tax=unclassified Methylocaldum TaxID=2622260 RepID=UPI00098A2BBC|nr:MULTISPECIES: YggT family protein [unclassified Methylocaldum]MBP1149179.1 YggT family protein [Methylocaldum sp. RMAD-M]MDV3241310.1 YggT family protein [Methylocaldum sp.]MVF20367.1 YggT family protein [Methylocaldum sp. BRCS4]